MIEFRGAALRLRDEDLPRVGATISVGEDEIHAVLDVESAGSGFDRLGRPKMLFEPHLFYRAVRRDKLNEAINLGVAYLKWSPHAYPADSYPRLVAAIGLDETAALKSASWGLGQVLGSNHRAAGYATVQDMVKAMTVSEGEQLGAMIAFIKAAGLAGYLRLHQWGAFANGYNGPGYRQNGYDTKLAQRYAVWSRIPDTPWRAGVAGLSWTKPWRTDGDVLVGKPEPALLMSDPDIAPPPPDVPPIEKPTEPPTMSPTERTGWIGMMLGWLYGAYQWALAHPLAFGLGTLALGLVAVVIYRWLKGMRA